MPTALDGAARAGGAARGSSGCKHYRSNPMCHALPGRPRISPHSDAWAALLFQPTRDYVSSFNANHSLEANHPFGESHDIADPPLADALREPLVPQIVACDAAPWSAALCAREHLQGATVGFPSRTEPAGNSDHHLAWTDPVRRGNWNCWLCARPGPPGATIHVGALGFCAWDRRRRGDELGSGTGCSNARATDIEDALGSIAASDFTRAEADPRHGTFGHALAVSALCADTSFVYPATASDGKNTDVTPACARHLTRGQRPPEGTRLFLDRSDAQVDALPLKPYVKAWLRTLDREHFGATIVDTNWPGAPGISAAYRRDDFSAQAREAGVPSSALAQIPIELDSMRLAREIRFCASGDCR